MDDSSPFVIVFRSGSWFEAYMAASALDGHEIDSLIVNDEICRIDPSVAWVVGGAKVLVAREDEASALDVMRLVYQGNAPYVGSFLVVCVAALGVLALLLVPWLWWKNRTTAPESQ